MRLSVVIPLISLSALPLVAVASTPTDATLTARTYHSCPSGQFSYLIPGSIAPCCLEVGGIPWATTPSDKYCPNESYYHPSYDCCVPKDPSTPVPTDSCPTDFSWISNCCQKTSPTAPNGCETKTNFEFEIFGIDICLPLDPPGSTCPPDYTCPPYYNWHPTYYCCVPTIPNCPSPPSKCSNGWPWLEEERCCKKPPPTPSGHWSKPGHVKKSSPRRRVEAMSCPGDLVACPLEGLMGSDWECVDPVVDLHSCGGCASTGRGKDCTKIKGAWNIACDSGKCVAYSCAPGYQLQNGTCIRL